MNKTQKNLLLILVVLVLLLGAASYYFFAKYNELKNNPQAVNQEEIETLVGKVSELILLPEGETPTIATVADPELLKGQAFFAHAQTGDKVLIYAQAQKAILYSPSTHRILEVAPVSIGESETPVPTTVSTEDESAE